jgi:hypothetical protein
MLFFFEVSFLFVVNVKLTTRANNSQEYYDDSVQDYENSLSIVIKSNNNGETIINNSFLRDYLRK